MHYIDMCKFTFIKDKPHHGVRFTIRPFNIKGMFIFKIRPYCFALNLVGIVLQVLQETMHVEYNSRRSCVVCTKCCVASSQHLASQIGIGEL